MIARIAMMCVSLGVAAWAAAPAAEAAPLRSLTFAVAYSITTTQQNHISGLSGDLRPLGAQGNMSEQHGFSVDDSGTMRIDVIAAPADRGLVIDVAYDGKITHQAPMRVAITSDGRLLYDPKLPLSAQAARVLPLLARGAFGDHTLVTGASWSDPAVPPVRGATNYRVTAVEAPTVTLAVSSDLEMAGPHGFDEHDDGTLTFATDVLAPLRWDVLSRQHRSSPAGVETTDMRLTATLTGDTFAKR